MWAGNTPQDLFVFEKQFDTLAWRKWLEQNWTYSILIAAIYIPAVFTGINIMKDRRPFNVRYPLIFWNILLGIFSIAGACRSVPVMINVLIHDGWYQSVCDSKYFWPEYSGIWSVLFVLSKVPELGDSVFIILKKQKMQLLHWYHHATVLICVFYLYSFHTSIACWFGTMNYFVHSLMYPYFAVRAAGIRLPRPLAMVITTLQVVQMVVGLYISLYVGVIYFYDGRCDVYTGQIIYSTIMYFTYMILFTNLFYKSYIRKPKPKAE
ncbi:elongation of very long chain fatty acids protein 6-like [Anneissia japonica]|uniref:elongation of very long chain fatty acids protein 6-like n=1 Tax=Anneissia japonica TaxID=1529436 RepID=UPI00142590B7|nr:elongation of very long chain fatty acids protein 6-like [Anneissia japonica]